MKKIIALIAAVTFLSIGFGNMAIAKNKCGNGNGNQHQGPGEGHMGLDRGLRRIQVMEFLTAADGIMKIKGRRTLEMVFLTEADGMVVVMIVTLMTNKQRA